jgi:hypothetical protein
MNWNRKSYDALHDWQGGNRAEAERILIAEGGQDIVDELHAADSLRRWWELCREAAEAVGERVVEASSHAAEQSLGACCRTSRCG